MTAMGYADLISLVSLVLGCAAPCAGPPVAPGEGAPPAPTAPLQLDAAAGLKEITRAYRGGATAERMALTLREGVKVVRRDEFVCRVNPLAGNETREADADLSLDLGPLRLFASGGMLVVTHVSKAETFFRQDYDPPLTIDKLATIVPPLLLPQLAFALSVEPPTVLAPYFRGVRWRGTTINPADEQPVLTVLGTTERNQIVMVLADGKTGRLKSMSIGMDGGGGGGAGVARTLEVTVTAVAAEPATKWMPSLAGRRMVGSLDKLTAAVGVPVAMGQRFAGVVMHSGGHEKVRLENLAALTEEGGVVALVLFDAPDDAGLAEAAADARATAKIVREEAPARSVIRTVAVMDAGTAITEAVNERGSRVLAALLAGGTAETDALWTTPRSASLGRLAPDYACAVVLLGNDLTVRGMVPVMMDDFAEGGTLRERIKAAFAALAWVPSTSSPPATFSPPGPSSEQPGDVPERPSSPEGGGGGGGGGG